MKLSKEEVEHVGLLARLDLSEEEKDRLTGHLNKLIEHFEELQELDTEDVEPTSHSIPIENVYREDITAPCLPPEEALSNAPDARDDYFIVPQVVEM